MTSINSNASAMVALQTLQKTNASLATLNDQISTGKKVSNARDNSAVWSIAQTMESDVMSFKTVTDSLNLASATVGVARNAAESITELLKQSKSLIASAQEENVDRTKIQADIDALGEQIKDIASAAQFNGLNLVKAGANVDFLSSFNRDSSGVTPDKISVSRNDLTIGTASFGASLIGAGDDGEKMTFSSNAVTVALTAANQHSAAGADAISDGESEVFTLGAQIISEGDSFRISLNSGDGDGAVDYEYVAAEGDTSNDIVRELAKQIQGRTGVDVAYTTSTNPTQSNVTLTLTNNSGSDWGAATALNQKSGGTFGGGLAAFNNIDVATSSSTAAQALTSIEAMINSAIDAAAAFGTSQKQIDTQGNFIGSLIDSMELGISALTDADLTEASAKLNALQVQQQLGLQALSIANQAPQNILALFR